MDHIYTVHTNKINQMSLSRQKKKCFYPERKIHSSKRFQKNPVYENEQDKR